jgi:hypothetical protein
MAADPDDDDDDDDRRTRAIGFEPTPATFSYNDALLTGRMTAEELAAVRAEIFSDASDAETLDPEKAEAALLAEATARVEQIKKRLHTHDYAGALEMAEQALQTWPTDAVLIHYADIARKLLCKVYLSHLGDKDDVPAIAIGAEALRAQPLDRWAAYLVSCIDGRGSIEEVLDVSGMSRLDSLRILYELCQNGVVRMKRARPPER